MIDDYPELLNHWYIVCQSHELKQKPISRTLFNQPLVLFRSGSGQPAAFADRCPHRNVPLSSGRLVAGQLACPYHGWQFDAQGDCQHIPGLCTPTDQNAPAHRLAAYPVLEQDGFIWVSVDKSIAPPPAFQYLHTPGYTHLTAQVSMTGSLVNAVENFLDGTHTHFVHSGLIRTEGRRKRVSAIVRRKGIAVEAQYPDEGQQSGLISQLFGAGIDNVYGRFVLPSTAQLEYKSRDTVRMLITLCFTPVTGDTLQVFAVVVGQAPRFVGWLAAPLIRLLFWQAFQQDRQIVALQTANIQRFGGEQFSYTDLDLLRPHILRLLKHGPFPKEDTFEKRIEMLM